MYDPHELAANAALHPTKLDRICAEHNVDLYDHTVKIDGQNIPVPIAQHVAIVRLEQGDATAAQCIGHDCLKAIEAALLPWAEEEAERLIERANLAAAAEETFNREDARGLEHERNPLLPWQGRAA